VHFNIGHLVIGGSDTKEPYGKYLVAMNKLSKGRHLSVGPSQPESSQLIDITGQKMAMLYESFTEPEPHFAQILKADRITPIEVYPKAENRHPHAVWAAEQAGVTRTGNKVVVKMMAIRSRFVPDRIDAQVGDEITVTPTSSRRPTSSTASACSTTTSTSWSIPARRRPSRSRSTRRACSRTTARTSARRCIRRCRATSPC
jgi:nitrous-oxide reductase